MSSTPHSLNLLSSHTFGRDHMEPPAMPAHIQLGQTIAGGQMGAGTVQPDQMYASGLPHDFDAIVRSVGEW